MTAQLRSLDRAFFDLSARVKLRVSGSDRLRFLNGQLTNDIRKATDSTALEACVLNAKGKMEAHLFAHAKGDSFIEDKRIPFSVRLKCQRQDGSPPIRARERGFVYPRCRSRASIDSSSTTRALHYRR